eukprot:2000573-Prymnesium_polylepis.1
MAPSKKNGNAPADAPASATPSKKAESAPVKKNNRKQDADTAKLLMWASPMIVLVAVGIAYVSLSGQAARPEVAHAGPGQRRDATPTSRRDAPTKRSTPDKASESTELPSGWGSTTDPSSGKTYYYKLATRESQWERPTEPCDGAAAGPASGEPASCASWASAGECEANPDFMRTTCKVTCEQADKSRAPGPPRVPGEFVDTWKNPSDCYAWASSGECENNKQFMRQNCAH